MYSAKTLFFATGSHPSSLNLPFGWREVSLDTCLKPSTLDKSLFGKGVAVIGSSHSAVLVLRNLKELGVPILNFYRQPFKYAEYREGWILYDNTGLKGVAADWARETFAEDRKVSGVQRHRVEGEACYRADHVTQCDSVVYATGFARNTLPLLSVEGVATSGKQEYDEESGALLCVPQAYGFGIAFPQRVTDREGNVESAVGLWKFMAYAQGRIEQWLQ